MISTPLGHSALSALRMAEVRDHLVERLGGDVEGLRMLEVGCGTGALLAELRDRGALVMGCEIGPQATEAEDRYGIPVLKEPLSPGLVDGRFDCVFSYGTLEHIEDLEEFLASCREVLEDGGLTFHSVPNAQWIFDQGRATDLLHEHVNYFTARNAERLLSAQGLTDVRSAPTTAGNELHVWGVKDSQTAVCSPTDLERSAVEEERTALDRFSVLGSRLLQRQCARVEQLVRRGSVGFYGGGFVIASQLPDRSFRFFDGDDFKHGKLWLSGLSPIEAPSALASRPVDHLVICPSHYFDEIVDHLRSMVGIPESTEIHDLGALGE